MNKFELMPIVEAIIFSTEQPIDAEKIAKLLNEKKERIIEAIEEIKSYYATNEVRGVEIVELAGGYFFRTKTNYAPYIKKVVLGREAQLSRSAIETLSVIAFKQPITRAEIEHLRGVDSSNAIRSLLEKKLIKIMGKKDIPGKPHVYGTTKEFLKVFGLKDLSQLPNLKEIKEMERAKEAQLRLLGDEGYEDTLTKDNS